jgi:hypothetical protein
MRLIASLFTFAFVSIGLFAQEPAPAPAPAPTVSGSRLSGVRKVYLLPMRSGFDQYLASYLASGKVLEVVADPLLADAVISESLGASFAARMHEIYGDTEKEKEQKKAAEEAKAKEKEDSEETSAELHGDTASREQMISSFSRGRGTVFFVDVKTMSVLWSVYMPPKNSGAQYVEQSARKTVQAIQAELKPKSAKSGISGWFK